MKKYPKIYSPFMRDSKTKVLTKELRDGLLPETVLWTLEEKIDGTNIRIWFDKEQDKWVIAGRTDNAEIPKHLMDETLDKILLKLDSFCEASNLDYIKTKSFILYGEGYGYKIQKGTGYFMGEKITGFYLFDIYFFYDDAKNGWWADTFLVKSCAEELDLVSPYFFNKQRENLVSFKEAVKRAMETRYVGEKQSEGFVIKPRIPLYHAYKERVIYKLKTLDLLKSEEIVEFYKK